VHSRYCTVEANYWQTRSIARLLCDSRASCQSNDVMLAYSDAGLTYVNLTRLLIYTCLRNQHGSPQQHNIDWSCRQLPADQSTYVCTELADNRRQFAVSDVSFAGFVEPAVWRFCHAILSISAACAVVRWLAGCLSRSCIVSKRLNIYGHSCYGIRIGNRSKAFER